MNLDNDSDSDNNNFKSQSLHISNPHNVQRLYHISWDLEKQEFTGVLPNEWKILLDTNNNTNKKNSITDYNINNITDNIDMKRPNITASTEIVNQNYSSGGIRCRIPLTLPERKLPISPKFDTHDPLIWSHKTKSNEMINLSEFLYSIGIKEDLILTSKQWQHEFLFHLQKAQEISKPKNLISLSKDPLLLILSYLDAKSIINVSSSCSILYPLLELSYETWRSLAIAKSKKLNAFIASTAQLLSSSLYSLKGLKNYDDCLGNYKALYQLERDAGAWDFMLNVLIKSDPKVGKTTMLKTFSEEAKLNRIQRRKAHDSSVKYADPILEPIAGTFRVGMDLIIRRIIVGGTIVKLQVWDDIGVSSTLDNVHMVCVIVNLYEDNGLLRAYQIAQEMIEHAKHVSFVLLGNIRVKQTRKISFSTAKEFATSRNILYFESNFMESEDLDKSFGSIAADMISNLKSLKIRLVAMDPHIDEDNKTCTLM